MGHFAKAPHFEKPPKGVPSKKIDKASEGALFKTDPNPQLKVLNGVHQRAPKIHTRPRRKIDRQCLERRAVCWSPPGGLSHFPRGWIQCGLDFGAFASLNRAGEGIIRLLSLYTVLGRPF